VRVIHGDAENQLVRTFRPRRRRLGAEMREVYDRTRERWSLDETGGHLDLDNEFGRSATRVLEIGCGRGDLVCDHAVRFRDRDIIAIDVHTRGIANILRAVDDHGLTNARVVEGDALVFVDRIADRSLDEVWFMFPDPWPKARQRSRRIVRDDVERRVARVLRPGGVIQAATDVDEYARHMRDVLARSEFFGAIDTTRPEWRIETVFERRGREAGRSSTDLMVVRNDVPWRDGEHDA